MQKTGARNADTLPRPHSEQLRDGLDPALGVVVQRRQAGNLHRVPCGMDRGNEDVVRKSNDVESRTRHDGRRARPVRFAENIVSGVTTIVDRLELLVGGRVTATS